MIELHCPNCGRKLHVSESSAGKKGRCPQCRSVVAIPPIADARPSAPEGSGRAGRSDRPMSALDAKLLDLPAEGPARTDTPDGSCESESALDYAHTPLPGYRRAEPEPPPRRRLPWFIDIFLYPTSPLCLALFVLLLTVPPFIRIVLLSAGTFILILFPFGWIIVILLYAYTFWYFATSVRRSSEGGLRAPDTVAETPGFGEIFWQLFRAIVCLLFFFLPAIVYFDLTRKVDPILCALLAYGVFMFPMGLLAVTVLDSFSGLNPIFLLGSIFSTFLPYCVIVLMFIGLGWVLFRIGSIWPISRMKAYASIAGFVYLLLVVGHLLGRFCWRYQERLNWDV